MRLEVTSMTGRTVLPVRCIDFFSLKRALKERGFAVDQPNPAYLTAKLNGVSANVFANGKVVFFFRERESAEAFVGELLEVLKNGFG